MLIMVKNTNYNDREDDINIYAKMAVEVVEFCCQRTNELTKIFIVFNLEVLITAWDKKNPCAVSSRKKKQS